MTLDKNIPKNIDDKIYNSSHLPIDITDEHGVSVFLDVHVHSYRES